SQGGLWDRSYPAPPGPPAPRWPRPPAIGAGKGPSPPEPGRPPRSAGPRWTERLPASRITPEHRPAGPLAAPVLPAATPAACLQAAAPDSPSGPSGVLVCVDHVRLCSRLPPPTSRFYTLRKLQAFTGG